MNNILIETERFLFGEVGFIIQQIILGVYVRNINAIKAYQKCGFIK
jgi:hypothetical protein